MINSFNLTVINEIVNIIYIVEFKNSIEVEILGVYICLFFIDENNYSITVIVIKTLRIFNKMISSLIY